MPAEREEMDNSKIDDDDGICFCFEILEIQSYLSVTGLVGYDKHGVQGVTACNLKKVIKQGLLPANHRSFSKICDTADRVLFASVPSNPCHSLHHLLPPKRPT